MATEDYVSVAADDWYQRRRNDAAGKFFRSVADQGPRKGEGGSTRQGIYCLTADGKLLAYKNAGQAPHVMREILRQGLREWQKLPEDRRAPEKVKVEEAGARDRQYTREPPPGGLIIAVHTRILDYESDTWCRGTCSTRGGAAAARDHLWLTAAERQALVPPSTAKVGDKFPLAESVAERVLRFHLVDNTRGEPPMWRREEIRRQQASLTVELATPTRFFLRLDGSALLATAADEAKADRGFDVRLLGYLGFDRQRQQIDRFDVVAVGEHWGEGHFTRGPRPGRSPLGIAFTLTSDKSATDRIPPQAARDPDSYFGRRRD